MVAKAHAKYLRISPRKVKIVADLIRGKSLAQATGIRFVSGKAILEEIREIFPRIKTARDGWSMELGFDEE